jgi:uncharacterized protein
MGIDQIVIDDISKAHNSVVFRLNENYVFYEKLTNSIHIGEKEVLKDLQKSTESLDYSPKFDNATFKANSSGKLEGLLLNVTENCDLNCGYCIYSGNYVGERINSKKNMTFETAKNSIDFFVSKSKNDASLIAFYGGEPTRNWKLIEDSINYAHTTYPDKTFVFSITSNFFAIEPILDKIIANQIYINISLDGPKKIHDKYRVSKNNSPTYDKILQNIRTLEQMSPGYVKDHIGLNGTCNDPQDFTKIIDYFIEQDNNYFSLRVNGSENKGLRSEKNHAETNKLGKYGTIYLNSLLRGEKPPKVLREFFDQPLKNIYMRSLKVMPDSLDITSACYPSERKLFVDTDGQFYMCEKFGGRLDIGDSNNGLNRDKILSSIDEYTNILNNKCTNGCWSQRLCTSCIQTAKDVDNNISVKGLSEKCEELKSSSMIGIAMYALMLKENPNTLEKYFNQGTV